MVKEKKLKLPVVKRKGKYINTITGRTIKSKEYADRINRAFKKDPTMTLHRAGGHGKYYPKKAMTEQSRGVRQLAYKSGTQLIQTKTLSGKNVYWSPLHKEFLTDIPIADIKKLDYWLVRNTVKVELYRITRDLINMYHIITWNCKGKSFSEPLGFDSWLTLHMDTYNKIERELKSMLKKYPLSKRSILYGNIHVYIYSDLDGWDSGIGFGFVLPSMDKQAFQHLRQDFFSKMNHYKNALEMNSYRNLALIKIVFYVYDSTRNVSNQAKALARYRVGIIKNDF